jgi:hypothetical protein
VLLEVSSSPFRRARSVNATGQFPSRIPRALKPGDDASATGFSAIQLAPDAGGYCQNSVLIMPFSTGANDDTYSLRVYGWRYFGGTDPATGLWIPCLLAELACVASSTLVGAAGKALLATEMFADAITLTVGNAGVGVDVVSPTGDVPAHALVTLKGFQLLELTHKVTTTPTGLNALVALL